jgi:acyl carrier protein
MENRIKNVMSAVFEISVEDINEESSPDSIDNWDSLNLMNLVVSLEEEFDIELDDSDIVEMLNFKLIVSIIQEKLSN